MRYTVYKQIKDILETVIEAFEYIENNDNQDISIQLLTDGKNAIENISEKIIENESSVENREVFNLSSILLERIPNAIHKLEYLSKKDDIEFIINVTKELLQQFEEHVEHKISVVFFAELGQKWDAMNSLYEAFMEREDCEVEVVLTPILRQVQNEDGTVKQDVIYEDYLTDLGIEFTPYEKYDISLDPPDMAFISNPYESVTIPQFWSENITEYTRLVYVPYYTRNNLNSNVFKREAQLPFINKSWKIIVQSKEVEEAYRRYSGSSKDNFLVSGLPKWDELFKVKENTQLKVPEWEHLTDKTIILWTIHYNIDAPTSTLVKHGKEIINIFKDRKDIALILRPHPMLETILKVYNNEHQELWKEIKDTISNSDNMVVDKNSSYKPAFRYSKALISEYSSIMTEYLMLEKPILWLKKIETDEHLKHLNLIESILNLPQAYEINRINEFIEEVSRDSKPSGNIETSKAEQLTIDGKNSLGLSKKLLNLFYDALD